MMEQMIWGAGIIVIAAALFLALGISHITDLSKLAVLITHPALITSTDVVNAVMSGVPALFLLAGIFEIITEIVKRYSKPKKTRVDAPQASD